MLPCARQFPDTRIATWLLLAAVVCGCSSAPSDGVHRRNVTLKLTYGGEPVQAARVDLEPSPADGKLMPMGGDLESGGSLTIRGVAVGPYVVVVTPPAASPLPDGSPPPVVEAADIPKKFRQGPTSPLKIDVTADKSDFEFDLKDL